MKKLRILHVILYADVGGLEKLIFDMARIFTANGHHVEILCLRAADEEYLNRNNTSSVSVTVMIKKHRLDVLYHYRVSRFIKKRKIDIIHAHSGCFWDSALFSVLTGCRYIYTAHGLPVASSIKARLEDIIAGFIVHKIVAVSDEIKRVETDRLRCSDKKIITILNGVDTSLFVPASSEKKEAIAKKNSLPACHFRIGTVGRLAPEKNYSMLIRAFAKVCSGAGGNGNIDLLFIGAGPQEQQLKKLVSELDIQDQVHFLGIRYDVHELVPMLDIFALSSVTEGTSISLLEAQACGVPAVVTRVGGNEFVIQDGINGLLCPVHDIEAMTSCMERILQDKKLQQRCSVNGRKRVKSLFSLRSMSEQYLKVYTGQEV